MQGNHKRRSIHFNFLCYIAIAMFGSTGLGQSIASVKAPENSRAPIHLSYAGIEIFDVYYGVGSFSPEERATALHDRLAKLSSDKVFDAHTVSVVEAESASEVTAGDVILVSISDRDAQPNNLTRQELAMKTKDAIAEAIEKDRSEKSPHNLAIAGCYAAAATLALILILFGLIYGANFASKLVQDAQGTWIRPMRIRSVEILTEQRIAGFALWLIKVLRIFAVLLTLYFYIPLLLSFFPWSANLAPKLLSFVTVPLKKVAHVILDTIPNLFFIFVIVMVSKYILGLIKIFFNEMEAGTLGFEGFHREWATPTYKLVRVLVIAFTLVVIFPYIPGSSSPAFQGVSVFLGVLFSFGSSSSIGNIVAGIVLTYMRPFKIGDRVKISDTIGDVIEKTLLVTRIRTIKNVDVTIPNSMILSSHIINFSSSALAPGLILNTTVTIGYDAPWKTVHDLLIQAARNTPNILSEPAPYVLQTSLDDFYVSYEINAFTRLPNSMATIYSVLHQNIQDAFNSAGVEIMSPHYTSIRDGNEITVPVDQRDTRYDAPKFKIEVDSQTDLKNI